MSKIVINVQGINRAGNIEPSSFSLNRALTNQADTLSFTVPRINPSDWKPSILNTVEVIDTDGTTVLFAGSIVVIQEEMNNGVENVVCQCRDWSFDMDRKLVTRSFQNQTVEDIINHINTYFMTGFTVNNVHCTTVVDYIAFNYEYPSKCIQQLAELVQYDWYVDSAKDIHFFSSDTVTSPFGLTDTNGSYYFDTLKIKRDASKIKNSITVRGGEYLGASYKETYVADGEQISFPIVNRYKNIIVKKNTVALSVGIDNLNDPTLFDCVYNFQEKSIKFLVANKPVIGDVIEITGNPYIPVLSKRTDTNSVNQYGVFEYKIIDASINTKQGALERAGAEIAQYGDELEEGSFETVALGLEVGQKINIQSDLRGLNEDFIITRISTSVFGEIFRHNVVITTTQTFGMIEFLQKLLMQKDKEIKIGADEVLDALINFNEIMNIFTDDVVSITTTEAPYRYDDNGIWDFSTWS